MERQRYLLPLELTQTATRQNSMGSRMEERKNGAIANELEQDWDSAETSSRPAVYCHWNENAPFGRWTPACAAETSRRNFKTSDVA